MLKADLVTLFSHLAPYVVSGRSLLVVYRVNQRLGTPAITWTPKDWAAPATIVLYPADVDTLSPREQESSSVLSPQESRLAQYIARSPDDGASTVWTTEFIRALGRRPFKGLPEYVETAEKIAHHMSRTIRPEKPLRVDLAAFIDGEETLPQEAAAERPQRIRRFLAHSFTPKGSLRALAENERVVLDLAGIKAQRLELLARWSEPDKEVGSTLHRLFAQLKEYFFSQQDVAFTDLRRFLNPEDLIQLVKRYPSLLVNAIQCDCREVARYFDSLSEEKVKPILHLLAEQVTNPRLLIEAVPTRFRPLLPEKTWCDLRRYDEKAFTDYVVSLDPVVFDRILATRQALDGASDELIARLAELAGKLPSLSSEARHAIIRAAMALPDPTVAVAKLVASLVPGLPLNDDETRWFAEGQRYQYLMTEERIRLFFPRFARAVATGNKDDIDLSFQALPEPRDDLPEIPLPKVHPQLTGQCLFQLSSDQLEWGLLTWSYGDSSPDDWELLDHPKFSRLLDTLLARKQATLVRRVLHRLRSRIFLPELLLSGKPLLWQPQLLQSEVLAVEKRLLVQAYRMRGHCLEVFARFSRLLGSQNPALYLDHWRRWLKALLPDDLSADEFHHTARVLADSALRSDFGPVLTDLPRQMEVEVRKKALERCLQELCSLQEWLPSGSLSDDPGMRQWWNRALDQFSSPRLREILRVIAGGIESDGTTLQTISKPSHGLDNAVGKPINQGSQPGRSVDIEEILKRVLPSVLASPTDAQRQMWRALMILVIVLLGGLLLQWLTFSSVRQLAGRQMPPVTTTTSPAIQDPTKSPEAAAGASAQARQPETGSSSAPSETQMSPLIPGPQVLPAAQPHKFETIPEGPRTRSEKETTSSSSSSEKKNTMQAP